MTGQHHVKDVGSLEKPSARPIPQVATQRSPEPTVKENPNSLSAFAEQRGLPRPSARLNPSPLDGSIVLSG
jgi:hypothetical protein